MKGVWLQNLTLPEAREWIGSGAPVVIPVGAISKEHGPHLPLCTDFLTARALGQRVADALPVIIAPVISSGYYPAFQHYPGSQHLSAKTFQLVIQETIAGFIKQGVKHLAIINTGVSTVPVIRVAVREILDTFDIRVHVADILQLGKAAEHLFEQKLGGHGDEHETSLIMAIKPESVHLDRAKQDYGNCLDLPKTVFYTPSTFSPDPESGIDYSATGVRGDPTLASLEKGQIALDAIVDDLVQGLRILFPVMGHASP